jgi:hypothetical protein
MAELCNARTRNVTCFWKAARLFDQSQPLKTLKIDSATPPARDKEIIDKVGDAVDALTR